MLVITSVVCLFGPAPVGAPQVGQNENARSTGCPFEHNEGATAPPLVGQNKNRCSTT